MKLSRYFFVGVSLATILTTTVKAGDISVVGNNSSSTVNQIIDIKFSYDSSDLNKPPIIYQMMTGVLRGDVSGIISNTQDICTKVQDSGARNNIFFIPNNNTYAVKLDNNTARITEEPVGSVTIRQNVTLDNSPGDLHFFAVLMAYPSDDLGGTSITDFSDPQAIINILKGPEAGKGGTSCSRAIQFANSEFTINNDGKVSNSGSSSSSSSGTNRPKATANTSVSGFGVVTSGPAETGNTFCDPKLAVQLGDTTVSGNKTSLGTISFKAANLLGLCNTGPILGKIINVAAILASIAFIIAIIYSGIILITATSEDAAAKAKKNLTWAVIGAVIVILANWVVPEIISLILATLN